MRNLVTSSVFDADLTLFGFPETLIGVDDGYWVILPPMSKGEHTINFGGDVDSLEPPLSVDVIYHITME